MEERTCMQRTGAYGTLEPGYLNEYYRPQDVALAAQAVTTLSEGGHTFAQITMWVRQVIQYMRDYDVWGVGDHFQDPLTTLDMRTGDCEDQAYVIASMLQALGYEAYVVMGVQVDCQGNVKGAHAWTEALAENGIWYFLDSTGPGGVWTTHEKWDHQPHFYPVPDTTICIYGARPGPTEPQLEPDRILTKITNLAVIESASGGNTHRLELWLRDANSNKGLGNLPVEIWDSVDGMPPVHIGTPTTHSTGQLWWRFAPGPGHHIITAKFTGTGEMTPKERPISSPSYEAVMQYL